MDEYLTFAATELYLAHWDGCAWSNNNYTMHAEPDGGPLTFLPWGIDQLCDDELLGGFSGVMKTPGPSWDPPEFGLDSMFGNGGRVQWLCFSSDQCISSLHAAFVDVMERADEMDLIGLAAEARDLVEDLLLEEAEEVSDPEIVVAFLDQVEQFLEDRPETLGEWLPCLAGETIDHDDDQHDGCTTDCNDWDDQIHPGADEVCNFTDNDCNGVLDDPPECPDCIDVELPDGHQYSLCIEMLSWDEAQQACLDRGQELASFHDEETSVYAAWNLLDAAGIAESWIGLNDLEQEGEFTWTDGSPLDFEFWLIDFPEEWADFLDCVVNHAALGWLTYPCTDPHAFVCKTPA
jgi:hypothetical protein